MESYCKRIMLVVLLVLTAMLGSEVYAKKIVFYVDASQNMQDAKLYESVLKSLETRFNEYHKTHKIDYDNDIEVISFAKAEVSTGFLSTEVQVFKKVIYSYDEGYKVNKLLDFPQPSDGKIQKYIPIVDIKRSCLDKLAAGYIVVLFSNTSEIDDWNNEVKFKNEKMKFYPSYVLQPATVENDVIQFFTHIFKKEKKPVIPEPKPIVVVPVKVSVPVAKETKIKFSNTNFEIDTKDIAVSSLKTLKFENIVSVEDAELDQVKISIQDISHPELIKDIYLVDFATRNKCQKTLNTSILKDGKYSLIVELKDSLIDKNIIFSTTVTQVKSEEEQVANFTILGRKAPVIIFNSNTLFVKNRAVTLAGDFSKIVKPVSLSVSSVLATDFSNLTSSSTGLNLLWGSSNDIPTTLTVNVTSGEVLLQLPNSLPSKEVEFNIEVLEAPDNIPIASFNVASTEVEVGSKLLFENKSTQAKSYMWDFGDGNTSIEANPTHIYKNANEAGYKVILIAKNDYNKSEAYSKVITVTPLPQKDIVIDFSYDDVKAYKVNEAISFTNNTVNASDYQWDFGDGNKSDEKNGSHAYTEAGEYVVKLTAYSQSGEQKDKSVTVKIEDEEDVVEPVDPVDTSAPAPIADFSYDKQIELVSGDRIKFENSSENALVYEWNFGDKSKVSSKTNPQHIFEKSGTYKVMLTAYSADKAQSDTKTIKVIIEDSSSFLGIIIILLILGIAGFVIFKMATKGSPLTIQYFRNGEELATKVFTGSISFDKLNSEKRMSLYAVYNKEDEMLQIEILSQEDEVLKSTTRGDIVLKSGIRSIGIGLGEYKINGTNDKFIVSEDLD